MTRKPWILMGVALLSGIIAIALFAPWIGSQSGTVLRVGSHTSILSAALDVTAATGEFEKVGLKVQLDHQESSKTTMPAVLSGDLQITIGSSSAGSFNHLSTGRIIILADAARVVPRLLVQRRLMQAGTVMEITHLRGRTVRVPREGSASHAALHMILKANNLDEKDVTLSFLSEELAVSELRSGNLAAAILNEPHASAAIAEGIASEPWGAHIHNLFGKVGQQHMVLYANRDYVAAHPETIRLFLKAYGAGIRTYLSERNKPKVESRVVRIIAEYTGASPELVIKSDWPLIVPDAQVDIPGMEAMQDFFLASHLQEQRVDLNALQWKEGL